MILTKNIKEVGKLKYDVIISDEMNRIIEQFTIQGTYTGQVEAMVDILTEYLTIMNRPEDREGSEL